MWVGTRPGTTRPTTSPGACSSGASHCSRRRARLQEGLFNSIYTDTGRASVAPEDYRGSDLAERSRRMAALGRKNDLFRGSDAGGERAAAMYSLIGTAKLNGLNPGAYLRHVLNRIADHPINRIDELLPKVVKDQLLR